MEFVQISPQAYYQDGPHIQHTRGYNLIPMEHAANYISIAFGYSNFHSYLKKYNLIQRNFPTFDQNFLLNIFLQGLGSVLERVGGKQYQDYKGQIF